MIAAVFNSLMLQLDFIMKMATRQQASKRTAQNLNNNNRCTPSKAQK